MWTVDRAALVFCVDQVEDLRFFNDAEERFQRAVRDLIQIANRLTNAILIISCLEDFYGQVRGVLAQSYIDRIEKAGPVALLESRTPEEARLIISKRLAASWPRLARHAGYSDPAAYFGPQFYEEFAGLSTRRLLEHAYNAPALQDRHRDRGARARRGGARQFHLAACGRSRPGLSRRSARGSGRGRLPRDLGEVPERVGSRDPVRRGRAARYPRPARSSSPVRSGPAPSRSTRNANELDEDVPVLDLRLKHKNGLASDAPRIPVQPPDAGRRAQAPARQACSPPWTARAASCCARPTSRPTARTRRRRHSASSAMAADASSSCPSPSGSA